MKGGGISERAYRHSLITKTIQSKIMMQAPHRQAAGGQILRVSFEDSWASLQCHHCHCHYPTNPRARFPQRLEDEVAAFYDGLAWTWRCGVLSEGRQVLLVRQIRGDCRLALGL